MPRVLIGEFGAIERLGIKELLDQEGCEVVAEEPTSDGLIERVLSALPDVVLIDLDGNGGAEIVEALTKRFPAVKVIACSSERPVMKVFPPFHHGESYSTRLSPPQLVAAVMQK